MNRATANERKEGENCEERGKELPLSHQGTKEKKIKNKD